MTRDEITKITQAYVGSNTPPPRLGFNEKTAYFNCVKEVQMLVASCPSIINYVAYLNNVKAYQLTSTIDKQATKLVQSITNVERNIVEATELESNIAEFKRLLEQQRAHASSASLIYNEEHNWLLPFAEKLKFYIKRESEVNEALELLLTTLPKSLSGTRVILSDEGNITCGGSAATLSYNNVTVDSAPLITSDTSILGSLVKNSKTTAELVTPVTGTTK